MYTQYNFKVVCVSVIKIDGICLWPKCILNDASRVIGPLPSPTYSGVYPNVCFQEVREGNYLGLRCPSHPFLDVCRLKILLHSFTSHYHRWQHMMYLLHVIEQLQADIHVVCLWFCKTVWHSSIEAISITNYSFDVIGPRCQRFLYTGKYRFYWTRCMYP